VHGPEGVSVEDEARRDALPDPDLQAPVRERVGRVEDVEELEVERRG